MSKARKCGRSDRHRSALAVSAEWLEQRRLMSGAAETWHRADVSDAGAVGVQVQPRIESLLGARDTHKALSKHRPRQLMHVGWRGPIVITHGGIYSGHWQSLDPNTPAVRIATSQPVIILNATIVSASDCISNVTDGVNLTVVGTTASALNPNVAGKSPGRFVSVENFDRIDLENNTLLGTSGIYLGYYHGNHATSMSVKVLRNSAVNIDGRHSDGLGGFLSGPDDCDMVQFCQLAYVSGLPGVQIAWNQVINLPRQSRVEDNISIYKSSGTPASPILIHDNYIQGAYPADPATQDYSGGGIMLADGQGDAKPADDPAYVLAYNNQIVSTTNYGIAISSGHDSSFFDNRIVSSGLLPNGAWIPAQNTGAYVWNSDADPSFTNNSATGNVVGWMHLDGTNQISRNDWWLPNASGPQNNVSLPNPITSQTEQAEYQLWLVKLKQSGIRIGAALSARSISTRQPLATRSR